MTAMTNPKKALWEKGDFTQIAASPVPDAPIDDLERLLIEREKLGLE
jgi:hypothetical protein